VVKNPPELSYALFSTDPEPFTPDRADNPFSLSYNKTLSHNIHVSLDSTTPGHKNQGLLETPFAINIFMMQISRLISLKLQ
jgi:hypothetical protein